MMEGLQKTIRKFSEDFKSDPSSSSSSSPSSSSNSATSAGFHHGAAALSSDQSRTLLTRAPRNMVSLWTCSKLCAIFFAAGIVVGYTLKRRVRHWASRILKRLRDD